MELIYTFPKKGMKEGNMSYMCQRILHDSNFHLEKGRTKSMLII